MKTKVRTSLIVSLLFCLYTIGCFFCVDWYFADVNYVSLKEESFDCLIVVIMLSLPVFLMCLYLLQKYSFERKKNTSIRQNLKETIKSEENYKTLIHRISDGFLSLDKNLHFTYANEKILEMTGKSREQLLGKSISEAFPEALESETYRLINRAFKEQVYISNVEFYEPLDLWQENHIYPSKDGVSVFIRDVSINKRAEAAARSNDKRFRAIIENSEDIISLMNEEGKITYVSPAFERISGYTSEEIVGTSLFNHMPSDHVNVSNTKLQALLNSPGIILHSSNRLRLKNGHFISVEGTVCNLLADKDVNAIVCNFRDITDAKKAAEDLLKTAEEKEILIKELSRNNEDLQQFSYITSHNLRGPIASLLGLSNLLSNFDISDPTLKQILLGIQKATLRFDETIRDLNTILSAKDQKTVKQETLLLGTSLDKAIALCEEQIKDCGAEIIFDFKSAPKVVFNKLYLESIFLNLLTNSLKYRDAERNLKIEVESEIKNGEVVLKFKDNGIGMDVNRHSNKLFKPYQRFHDKAEGKGLGLFIIKSGLESFGGKIEVVSTLKEGTEFIIHFGANSTGIVSEN